MVALAVILTFAVMLLVDHLVVRQPILIADDSPARTNRPRLLSPVVAGFSVPDNLRYHPGHTWAASETAELVRIGIDDFAARLAGKVESIDTPTRGQWVRQGQKIVAMHREGRDIELVSPIEGTVVDINQAVIDNPELARKDPYGDGWLIAVNAPDARTNFRNLLGGNIARRWMEEAALRLQALLPMPAGAVAQDGGMVVDDLSSHITDSDWKQATREFFLMG